MSLNAWIEQQKEYRRRKKAFFEKANSWSQTNFSAPMVRVFGQNLVFPCGSPKQFYRAAVTTRKLAAASDRAARKAEKLDVQLRNIQTLYNQLHELETVNPCNDPSKVSSTSHIPE